METVQPVTAVLGSLRGASDREGTSRVLLGAWRGVTGAILACCRERCGGFGHPRPHHPLEVAGDGFQRRCQQDSGAATEAQAAQAGSPFELRGGGLDAGADGLAWAELAGVLNATSAGEMGR